MPNYREEEIISGCLRDDRVAQKALYDQYKTQMYTLSYRITNNFEDANDVLQEGFIQVFESLKSFKGQSQLGTWIHTIIARAALKKIKHKIHFDELAKIEKQTAIDWGSISDIQYLEKAITALPAGYRSIFTLYEIEGLKHKEIAEMMNISVNTSKTQLRKAKLMLREKLKNIR